MKPTGCTFVIYDGPMMPGARYEAAALARLRAWGMQPRVISINNGTYWMPAEGLTGPCRLWADDPPYPSQARALYTQHGFDTLWDSWNCLALPWHGARWVDEQQRPATTQDFNDAVFVAWAKEYIRFVAQPGLKYRLCFGNEPEAHDPTGKVPNPYLNDEDEFRRRYVLLAHAVAELEADATFKGSVMLGAGGWVHDWPRAGAFVAWCKDNGTRLDFVDVHIYQDASRLAAARDAIGPDMPIAILESGAEWDHRIKAPSAPKQKAWFRAMDKATDADGNVIAWHIMHGAGASNLQALALMGPRGALTPLGKMAEGGK